MLSFVAHGLNGVASFAAVNGDVQQYLKPIMFSLVGLAGAVSAFFIVLGGIEYMTSSAKPERLEHAKKILRNALVGLVIVIAAGTLTAILTSAYQDAGGGALENVPSLTPVDVDDGGGGITEVLINAIIGLFKHIIEAAASPFINALDYFTHSTPLMADNPAVFKLWVTVLGIANALFVAGVGLIGFQVMSSASLGLEEVSLRQLLPKLILTFLLMNMSIFAIDAIIALSNAMISAIENAYGSLSVWDALKGVASEAGSQGLVALLIMVVFMILAVVLLIYYIMRIVVLFVGAVISPIVALLQIIPGFKDFTVTATKAYVVNVFVLFVHVVILTLVATLFESMRNESLDQPFDPVMTMLVGVGAMMVLLRTQAAIMQVAYVSTGPRALRVVTKQLMNGITRTKKSIKTHSRSSGGSSSGGSSTGKPTAPKRTAESYK